MAAAARILVMLLLSAATVARAAEPRFQVPVGDSPALGSPDAAVTLVEFIDYQ